MRTVGRTIALATATLMLSIPAVTAAAAAPDNDGEFGRHVAACAQGSGHDGTDNPGMHHGASGWDGEACP